MLLLQHAPALSHSYFLGSAGEMKYNAIITGVRIANTIEPVPGAQELTTAAMIMQAKMMPSTSATGWRFLGRFKALAKTLGSTLSAILHD